MNCNRCTWHPDRHLTDDTGQHVPTRTQLEWHADDLGHTLCCACGQSLTEHEPQTCETCLTATQHDLKLIVQLHAELPQHLGQPPGQSFGRRGGDEHTLPGGTIMALLGPGSAGGTSRRLTKLDVARGREGREHCPDNHDNDPPSVTWTLLSWATDWAETRNDTLMAVTVPDIAGYLEVTGRWAANQHPAYAAYTQEIRALRVQLEQVTGRTRHPTRAGADCFRCGHPLQRQVDPATGLEDDLVTCTVCRDKLTAPQYTLALRAAAEAASRITIGGETYATPEALAHDLGRSPHTLTNWARRDGRVRHITRAGILFIHKADAQAAHNERATRRNAG